jgi:hypothetical protein
MSDSQQNQKNVEALEATKSSEKEATSNKDVTSESMTRRVLLTVGSLPVLSVLLQACGFDAGTVFSPGSKKIKTVTRNAEDAEGATEDVEDEGEVENETPCDPMAVDYKPNIDGIEEAPAQFIPKVKMYGSHKSALLGIHFDQYVHSAPIKISSFALLRESGEIVASYHISGADVKEDNNSLYPMMMNCIRLKSGEGLIMVIMMSNDKQVKLKIAKEQLMPEVERPNIIPRPLNEVVQLPVFHLTSSSIPDGYADNLKTGEAAKVQPMANIQTHVNSHGFTHPVGAFLAKYTFGGGRKLNTVQKNAIFSASPNNNNGLAGFTITDIMGNPLPLDEFDVTPNSGPQLIPDFLKYPTFVCYKEKNEKIYRTIITVG